MAWLSYATDKIVGGVVQRIDGMSAEAVAAITVRALGVIADVRIARTEGGSPSDEERIEARLRAQQVQNQQQQQQQQQQ